MFKKNIVPKNYRRKILTTIYGQFLLLFIIFCILLYLETKDWDQSTLIYLLVAGFVLYFIFFEVKRILSYFEAYENSTSLYQDSFEVLENINLYIIDLNLNYLYMNKSDISFMEKYYGITPQIGDNVSKYLSKLHIEHLKENVNVALSKGFQTSSDTFNYEGKEIYLYTSYSPVYNAKGQVYAICCITMNVTEQVIEKEKFIELIYQDPLTNVYNRRKVDDYYKDVLQKNNQSTWIFVFDLDNFKNSNDEFGHSFGDRILIDFSNILKIEFPSSAIISRMGGDEFCVLISEISYQDSIGIQSNIKMRMKQFEKYGVSVSIGRVFAENTKKHEFIYFLDKADKEMYNHKNSQKRVHLSLS
ncbi:sensor domain-containing diguanylate cyclase [Streptococcus parauberis]|uniref:sensor domain-containing diguanylate cyclase n=1 Tax=Streptococcus parauberis TaxID=1348 RepID=UPI00379A6601